MPKGIGKALGDLLAGVVDAVVGVFDGSAEGDLLGGCDSSDVDDLRVGDVCEDQHAG